jgi:hypothetical protein
MTVQRWLLDLWKRKDEQIEALLAGGASPDGDRLSGR